MLKFYNEIDIDPFKQIVSLPGISRKLLFRNITERNIFALFSKKTKNLYSLFDKNIVGGHSIVFTGYHEAGVTKIRSHQYENPKLCRIIKGFDCNR